MRSFFRIKRGVGTKCKLTITSHWRTPKQNKKVGGAKNSYHLYGRALDVVAKGADYCKVLFENLALEHGLSVIKYEGHTHIDNRENQICLTKKKKERYFRYCNNGKKS